MYLIIIFICLEVSLTVSLIHVLRAMSHYYMPFQIQDSSVDINFKTYEMCKETPETPMTFVATFRKINSSITLADLKAVLPVDLGNDVDVSITFKDRSINTIFFLDYSSLTQL